MESFFSRYKNALVLIVVLFAQVIGVAMQVRRPLPREHAQPDAGGVRLIRYWAISLVSPPERFVHWLGSSILGLWDNYLDLVHVRQQNRDLQAELQRIRLEQGGIVEDARQGQRLQKLLGFEEKYVYKTVPAQIIGTSGTEQSRILSIDKGAKDGLAVDMPVITPNGIVGRIREVFPHTSQVLEISDPTSGAGVILATTRVRGILRGNALGQPEVVNVMPDDRIKAGEQVITSGGDQIFPRGLAVGTVERVVTDPERDPMVDILIRPAANLSQLEEVLVITNMGDQLPPREKLDLIQSQAAASAEQLRASEVLAERLPSRIDPDAPDSEDESADNGAAANGGVPVPLRPPAALHPDHFSPNMTPPAQSLTPGARAAAELSGHGNSEASAKPHPPAASSSGDTAGAAAAIPPKKAPSLVPDDGSRPPATMTAHPPASPSENAGVPHRAPAVSGENSRGERPGFEGAATRSTAIRPDNNAPAARNISAPPSAAGEHPVVPKTTIVVDGPLPARRSAPPANGIAGQHSSAATGQHPAAPLAQHPAQHPATAPAQRKGPELVPDDGSRPPSSMLHPKPKPQQAAPQPQGGTPQ